MENCTFFHCKIDQFLLLENLDRDSDLKKYESASLDLSQTNEVLHQCFGYLY